MLFQKKKELYCITGRSDQSYPCFLTHQPLQKENDKNDKAYNYRDCCSASLFGFL